MKRRTDPAEQGFTLIEILVAVTLLGVLLVTVLSPLGGLYGLSRTTTAQVDSVTRAQQVLEQVKGLWGDQAAYDRGCVTGLNLGGAALTATPLNAVGAVAGAAVSPSAAAACASTALPAGFVPVPLKRVSVTVGSGAGSAALALDVQRPR